MFLLGLEAVAGELTGSLEFQILMSKCVVVWQLLVVKLFMNYFITFLCKSCFTERNTAQLLHPKLPLPKH
jgi:hypothetical protein